VPQDDETAFRWMHGAAEAGHVFAQAWMGDVLFRGQGVIRDEALAMQWYAHAAAQGHEGARAALGSTAQ
jgi:TPR repeat protein